MVYRWIFNWVYSIFTSKSGLFMGKKGTCFSGILVYHLPPWLTLINGYRHTVDCIYLWTHALKTCFQMTSNFCVSGVKLWSLADRKRSFALKILTINTEYGQNFTLEVIQVNLCMHINTDQHQFLRRSLYIQSSAISKPECVELSARKLSLRSAKLQSLRPEMLTSKVIWKHVFSTCVHR